MLKEVWTGEKPLPLDLGQSVTECLCDLRDKLAVAEKFATSHAAHEQHRWASRYNLRSRQKRFDVGEQVLILTPDSTTRMWSRWKAPATVVEVKSPNSYIVEIDGRRQHAYSNKLRRYDVRVDEVICNTLVMSDMTIDSCSIVHDKDKNFRPIRTVGKVESGQGERLPSRMIGLPADKWSHQTDETQHREYLGMRSSGCSFIRAIKKILQPIRDVTDAADKECPIAFYSKKYNDTQRAWSTIDKEAFACLEALRRFKHWIYGYRVHLYSDHNPLSYLTESIPKSAKLLRWALALQEFDIVFHYKAGKTSAMAVPDCLSRLVEI